MNDTFRFRYDINISDPPHIRAITESTGVFSPVEISIAVELADERLAKGPASGYHFIFAEREGKVLGYTCYGPIALTAGSYDLYWIAVDKSTQGLGLGVRCWRNRSRSFVRRVGGGYTSRPRPGPLRPYAGLSTSDRATTWRSCWRSSMVPATARRFT